MPDLKVTDADFDNAITGLERTKYGFEHMKSVGDDLAGAVGHAELASACKDLVSSWSVNRDRIQRAIDKHLELLKQTKQAFDEAERKLTRRGKDCPEGKPRPAPEAGPKPAPAQRPGGAAVPSLGTTDLGSGGGVNSVTGGSGSASLGSTDTEPHKDVNQVTGGSASADLGQDLPPGAPEVGKVQGGGSHGEDLDDVVTGPHQDASRVDDTPANVELIKQLQEQGLPVFAVDGKVQRPLGQVEGLGTLLGSQDEPPTISAVVDGNGKVVDIADLKPEYDEQGNLTALNQVPVEVADLGAGTQPPAEGEARTPGVVDGSAAPAPTLDTPTQEAVNQVKELFGDLVDVALTGGKEGGEPTLTVAGVSGIGLAALATLTALRRSGDADGGSVHSPGEGRQGLRSQFHDLFAGMQEEPEPRQVTDRQSLIDALLKDLPPESAEPETGSGPSAEELRASLAELAEDTSTPSDGEAQPPYESPESLRAALSALWSRGDDEQGGDLGGDLPPVGDLGLGAAAVAGDDGGASGSADGLGRPLPGAAEAGTAGAASALAGSDVSEQVSEAGYQDEIAEERRNAHMMGGMGMAAGMSAAGGRTGLTGAEEAKRNEEARRLRERLASSKEGN